MQYHLARRMPHTVSSLRFWKAVSPLVPPFTAAVAATSAAAISAKFGPASGRVLEGRAREVGDHALQVAQQKYFDAPGLDTLTIRQANRFGAAATLLGALYLRAKVTFGLDPTGRSARNLTLVPKTGYDSLMVGGLMVGRSLGYFVPGKVRHALWWDSAKGDGSDESRSGLLELPSGHPKPQIRRFNAPRTLGDVAADIDDMYWAEAYGQPIKVVRVGSETARRWVVIIPGTEHLDFRSQPNPADIETNMEEELNIASDLRTGVIAVVKDAMKRDGLSEEEMVSAKVLAAGHSLGGIVAAALASTDPASVGFTVDMAFTMGSPTRRLVLRPDAKMVAVEHEQDIIPAFDGTPRRDVDQRVTYSRSLTRPAYDPLFYAHSSATYTETVRRMEERFRVVPYGRLPQTAQELQDALVGDEVDEPRVLHYYVWRDVEQRDVGLRTLDPDGPTLDVGRPKAWRPVSFDGDVTLSENSTTPLKERIGRAKKG